MNNLDRVIFEISYEQDAWQGRCDTHESRYFGRIFSQIGYDPEWKIADPFARNCPIGTHTNDLNPETLAQDHMDALEWLKLQPSNFFDLVILDPPFSDEANDRIYDHERIHGEKSNIYTQATYFKGIMMEIFRILKPFGRVLRFGYTTSSLCKGLELMRVWCVNFYSPRNDVLVALFYKNTKTLDMFLT